MGAPLKSRGYTLMEVLVALLILAVVLPGLTVFLKTSRGTQVGSFHLEQAAAIAQFVHDSLGLVGARVVVDSIRAGRNHTTVRLASTDYNIRVGIEPRFGVGGDSTNWVLVDTVSWTQADRTRRIVVRGVLP